MSSYFKTSFLIQLLVIGSGCVEEPGLVVEGALGRHQAAIINGDLDHGHLSVGMLHSGGVTGCTATLIGKRILLTAAHCVTTAEPPYELLSPVEFYPDNELGMQVANVVVHPDYAGGNKSDLALVFLGKDIDGLTPLPISRQTAHVGEPVELIGYGKTSETSGQFGTKRKAKNVIGKVTSQLYTMFGASGSSGNLCNGDSGGPTFATRQGQEILIGIHSTKGGSCGQEGHDMRVDLFADWIDTETKGAVTILVPTDQDNPAVDILSPAAESRVPSTFQVDVLALDDLGIDRVQLFIDGTLVDERLSQPFSFTVKNLADGMATIEVVARDTAGNTSSATAQVSIDSTLPPTYSPSSIAGSVFGSTCQRTTDCQSGLCIATHFGSMCSSHCVTTDDCPGTTQCVDALCLPQGATAGLVARSFGTSCTGPADCDSGLCAQDPITGAGYCTQTCSLEQDACPSGSFCQTTAQSPLCAPVHALGDDQPMGCQITVETSSGAASWPWMIVLLIFGLRQRLFFSTH